MSNITFIRKPGAQVVAEYVLEEKPDEVIVFMKKGEMFTCTSTEVTDITFLLGALVRLQQHLLTRE